MKTCNKCKLTLALSFFCKRSSRKDGLDYTCRSCMAKNAKSWRDKNYVRHTAKKRAERLLRLYGLKDGEYEEMLERQGGVCRICGMTETRRNNTRQLVDVQPRLMVDHDAITGRVRALLCHQCNVAIGSMRHDPTLLDSAAMYLRSHGK